MSDNSSSLKKNGDEFRVTMFDGILKSVLVRDNVSINDAFNELAVPVVLENHTVKGSGNPSVFTDRDN